MNSSTGCNPVQQIITPLPHGPRWRSLDVFRGLTIALMIVVNSPGNQTAYAWLRHASWDGCTLADLVFPFFIVILGASLVLSLSALKPHQALPVVVKRSIWLFLLGLFLNAFPLHFHPEGLRIMGVLQRIAICYFFSALLVLTASKTTQTLLAIGLLIGYWLLLRFYPVLQPFSPEANLVGLVDQYLLTPGHLYTPAFDPEGVLSTLPAIASTLLGNLLGYCLLSNKSSQQKLRWFVQMGLLFLIAGGCSHYFFPCNKSLWSSSYALWTAGWAYLVFAGCFILIERYDWHLGPFELFGQHALLVFMLHVLFLKIQAHIYIPTSHGESVNLRVYLTNTLFGSLSPRLASLFYALAYTGWWWLFLTLIYRRKSSVLSRRSREEPI